MDKINEGSLKEQLGATKELVETWKNKTENPKNVGELSREAIEKLEARTRTVRSRVAEAESKLNQYSESGDERRDLYNLRQIKSKLDKVVFMAEKEMEGYFKSFLPSEIFDKMSNLQNEMWQKYLDDYSEIKKDYLIDFESTMNFVSNQEMNTVNPEGNLVKIKFQGKVEEFQSMYDQNLKAELEKLNLNSAQDYSVYDLKYNTDLFDKGEYEGAEDKERVVPKVSIGDDFVSKGKINI
jgi:uncharacterized protein (UPF0147 family)